MGKAGKILAIFVAILAVAAAVGAVFVNLTFQKYAARATKMATGLTEITATLNQGSEIKGEGEGEERSPEDMTSKVTFTPKTPLSFKRVFSSQVMTALKEKDAGTLSWSSYWRDSDKAHNAFNATVDSINEFAHKIIDQRNQEADAIVAMSVSLGLPKNALPPEALKNVALYSAKITLAKDYAAAMRARDTDFLKAIKGYASSVGKNANALDKLPAVSGAKVVRQNYNGTLNDVANGIRDAVNRRNAYANALAGVVRSVPLYRFTFKPAELNGGKYSAALAALNKDLAGINNKLKELDAVKKQLAAANKTIQQLKQQIAQRDQQIRSLNQQLTRANQQVSQMKAAASAGKGPSQPLPPVRQVLNSVAQMDKNFSAPVTYYDREWNFVVAAAGNDRIVVGAEVVLTDGEHCLARGKVKKVDENVCLINLTAVYLGIPSTGTTVILAHP